VILMDVLWECSVVLLASDVIQISKVYVLSSLQWQQQQQSSNSGRKAIREKQERGKREAREGQESLPS
jgi:hypothetical protein